MNDTYFVEHPTSNELCEEIGSSNWVLHRRTKQIVERYGETVVCLSRKQYGAACERALSKRRAKQMCEGA